MPKNLNISNDVAAHSAIGHDFENFRDSSASSLRDFDSNYDPDSKFLQRMIIFLSYNIVDLFIYKK